MTNPMDPFGIMKATQEHVMRAAAQAREAARQAQLSARKADVSAAFVAWSNQPDRPATENLKGAVEAYLTVLGS